MTWAQQAAPAYVPDCQPCTFAPAPGLSPYSFTFEIKTTPEGRIVTAIDVARDKESLQRLPVSGMVAVPEGKQFFFGGIDLNLDGSLDLMLITRQGVANSYSVYWLFDPKTDRFVDLGVYPVLHVDPKSRELSSYERGGSAGLIHTSKRYRFDGMKLIATYEETQSATKVSGVFRRVVREWVNGSLKVTKTDTVRAPR